MKNVRGGAARGTGHGCPSMKFAWRSLIMKLLLTPAQSIESLSHQGER
jgi:hypothetical protein